MSNCFLVVAKMDEGDRPFPTQVELLFPKCYELVPGHAWIIEAPSGDSAFDVAKVLGLHSEGDENASGIIVPARGYWGYAHKDMWNVLDAPAGADVAGMRPR